MPSIGTRRSTTTGTSRCPTRHRRVTRGPTSSIRTASMRSSPAFEMRSRRSSITGTSPRLAASRRHPHRRSRSPPSRHPPDPPGRPHRLGRSHRRTHRHRRARAARSALRLVRHTLKSTAPTAIGGTSLTSPERVERCEWDDPPSVARQRAVMGDERICLQPCEGKVFGVIGGCPAQLVRQVPGHAPEHGVTEEPDLHSRRSDLGEEITRVLVGDLAAMNRLVQRRERLGTKERGCQKLVLPRNADVCSGKVKDGGRVDDELGHRATVWIRSDRLSEHPAVALQILGAILSLTDLGVVFERGQGGRPGRLRARSGCRCRRRRPGRRLRRTVCSTKHERGRRPRRGGVGSGSRDRRSRA